MVFWVMDEAVAFPGRGLALVVNEGESEAFVDGCRIRDVLGGVHTVEKVSRQEALTLLYLREGDPEYFGRLFRNVRVDATLFTLLNGEGGHGA